MKPEAGVSGAKVNPVQYRNNQKRKTTTSDENGNFIFTSVPGGTDSITVKKDGFHAFSTTGLTVTPTRNFVLTHRCASAMCRKRSKSFNRRSHSN